MRKLDRTTYSQQDTDRVPRILEYESDAGGISYKIHRYIDSPNTWYLSSREFCNMVDLHTDDFAEAEKKAANLMKNLAERKIKELVVFVEDIAKSFNAS